MKPNTLEIIGEDDRGNLLIKRGKNKVQIAPNRERWDAAPLSTRLRLTSKGPNDAGTGKYEDYLLMWP